MNLEAAIAELARGVLKKREGVSSSDLLVEVDVEGPNRLAFLGVHFVFEIAQVLFKSVN